MHTVSIFGAGLAGCEAAYILAKGGIKVNLYEMKPKKFSPAHKLSYMSELLKEDPVTAKLIDMTPLGLVEITRKKVHMSLAEQLGRK